MDSQDVHYCTEAENGISAALEFCIAPCNECIQNCFNKFLEAEFCYRSNDNTNLSNVLTA